MKPIKAAILSSNSVHAPSYVDLLQKNPNFEWIAMSVSKEDLNRIHAGRVPEYVKIYETDEELLGAHPELDAVILAGSNDRTYKSFVTCAKYGIKNILTMKMPTFFMDEYDEMQRLARENGMNVQVELEMHFHQSVKKLKELCDSGVIGKLLSLRINNTTVCLPPKFMPWVTDPSMSYGKAIPLKEGETRGRGGAMTDHPHPFDLARYFSDSEFESVYADISPTIRPDLKVEDGVFVLGKMKNGVVVNIDPSYSRHENKLEPFHPFGPGWEGYPKRVEVDVVLNGDKGSIVADCFHLGVFYIGLPYNTYAFHYSEGISDYSILNEFADSIRTGRKACINLDSHRKTIEAMTACYESISLGKPVKLQ